MTENEALEILNNESDDVYKVQVALKVARKALEEIQQYRAIGTIEEFKALNEKLEKIKFIINEKHYLNAEECDYGNYYTCENALMIKDIEEILET